MHWFWITWLATSPSCSAQYLVMPKEEKIILFIRDRERTAAPPILYTVSCADHLPVCSRFLTVSWERSYSYRIIKKLQKVSIQTVTTATYNIFFLKIPFICYSRATYLCYSCCFLKFNLLLYLKYTSVWIISSTKTNRLPHFSYPELPRILDHAAFSWFIGDWISLK